MSPGWEASHLRTHGYVVISDASFLDPQLKVDFLNDTKSYPELLPNSSEPALGAFGAMGCPSSFHSPTVRKLRQWAAAVVIPRVMKPYMELVGKTFNVEQYMERATVRKAGTITGEESWHRDTSIFASGDDFIFGGWLNLDSQSQWFSCVPGSQLPDTEHPKRGFGGLPKEEHAALKAASMRVEIPPGCILVFVENLIHEVLAKRVNYQLCRVHLGWRLTHNTAIRHDMPRVFALQGVPLVKSGQDACMWPNG